MSDTSVTSIGLKREIVALMPILKSFSFRFVRSGNDADDLVQEAVCRALHRIDQFEPGTSLRSWLFTIIRNLYNTRYRQTVREGCGRLDDAATIDVPVSATQEWAMRALDLDAALLRLTVGERQALLLVANGVSYGDAALACGCQVGTIKSRVSRGRLHLAILLGETDPVKAVSLN